MRSLENQAAYALSQADLAARTNLAQQPHQAPVPEQDGTGWRLQVAGAVVIRKRVSQRPVGIAQRTQVLLGIMKTFQKVVVNWGIAIILLTVLVKLLLYPLTHKQMQSMEQMRKLQPQLDAMAKKYGSYER